MSRPPSQSSVRVSNETEAKKQPYEPPLLKEHGDAKEVTLQTFFGTFSPN